jgi:hypothetical protein
VPIFGVITFTTAGAVEDTEAEEKSSFWGSFSCIACVLSSPFTGYSNLYTINLLRKKMTTFKPFDNLVESEPTGIRPYGPGNFNTKLDAYVYEVSLDGGTEEDCRMGDSWCSIMREGMSIFKDHDPTCDELTDEEYQRLLNCAGIIMSENSDGFVHVAYYDDRRSLEAVWAEMVENQDVAEE